MHALIWRPTTDEDGHYSFAVPRDAAVCHQFANPREPTILSLVLAGWCELHVGFAYSDSIGCHSFSTTDE